MTHRREEHRSWRDLIRVWGNKLVPRQEGMAFPCLEHPCPILGMGNGFWGEGRFIQHGVTWSVSAVSGRKLPNLAMDGGSWQGTAITYFVH